MWLLFESHKLGLERHKLQLSLNEINASGYICRSGEEGNASSLERYCYNEMMLRRTAILKGRATSLQQISGQF